MAPVTVYVVDRHRMIAMHVKPKARFPSKRNEFTNLHTQRNDVIIR